MSHADYVANVYLGLVIIFTVSLIGGGLIARAMARAHVRRVYQRAGLESPFPAAGFPAKLALWVAAFVIVWLVALAK